MQCSKIAEKKNKLIFGVQNDKDCYVGDDLSKAKKMGVNDTCGFRGNKYAFELYQRNPPFEPKDNKLSKKDFETFNIPGGYVEGTTFVANPNGKSIDIKGPDGNIIGTLNPAKD
mgnify:CR=1 FL=1